MGFMPCGLRRESRTCEPWGFLSLWARRGNDHLDDLFNRMAGQYALTINIEGGTIDDTL
jgi:hypothetical protein